MDAAQNKLIVALDVPAIQQARELVALLRNEVGMFKVGSQLFTAAGPEFVREIVKSGLRVFLDLKFHDIPNTVAAAAVEATRLGVTLFNVHAAGGAEMMQRTAEAVTDVAAREGLQRPSVIAVTVFTSSDEATLRSLGINHPIQPSQVTKTRGCWRPKVGWTVLSHRPWKCPNPRRGKAPGFPDRDSGSATRRRSTRRSKAGRSVRPRQLLPALTTSSSAGRLRRRRTRRGGPCRSW